MATGAELLVFVAVAAAAVWFIVGKSVSVTLMTTSLVALIALRFWSPEPPPLAEQQAPPKSTRLGYVSSTTCRSCHPRQFKTWHDSYHRTMTQVASPEAILAPYEATRIKGRGRTFELDVRDGELWARDLSGDALARHVVMNPGVDPPSTMPVIEGPIVMTTGSHHMQMYWIRDQIGVFRQLNWIWLLEDQRWVPTEDVYSQPHTAQLGIGGNWAHHCSRCHSTAPEMRLRRPGRPVADTKIGELGIACEACHGPAAEHVAKHRNPVTRYLQHFAGSEDPTIVNPAKLDHVRSAQVCGHCHSVLQFRPEGDGWDLDNGSYFRPGDDLAKIQDVATLASLTAAKEKAAAQGLPSAPGVGQSSEHAHFQIDETVYFWPDGTARAAGREYTSITKTGCFTDGEMDCMSCHSMHESDPNDQLAAGMEADGSCFQCHAEYSGDDQVEAHTHHAASSTGARCNNCHMANTTYGLLKMIRNHQVDSPVVVGVEGGQKPNACNLCHLDRTLSWSQDRMADWYQTRRLPLTEEEREVPAGLLWLVRGDSPQRSAAAWHLGWPDARAALPTGWGAPWLARSLDDPYAAVRYIAGKSLQRLENFENFEYDYLESEIGLHIAVETAKQLASPRNLADIERQKLFDLLRASRDNTPILYLE